jgi:hypothetical protein
VKTALGMIIKNLDSDMELMGFVENAEKYGHMPDCVIVAYSHYHDPEVEKSINRRIPFFAVDIKNPQYCREQMLIRGLPDDAAQALLECPLDMKTGLVPYGFNRMIVVMEAVLREMDTVFFIDSDVYPKVIRRNENGITLEEIDFFGAHLKHLNSGAQVTTGEYSGYNILPHASFKGMDDLLAGVQKSEMQEYWETSEEHRCLVVQADKTEAKPCKKVLGGNMAIKLSAFAELPPFFSSHYMQGGETFLCRGEDTMLGLEIAKSEITCMDIGLNPLHDTYKNYPEEPDLRNDKSTQERFYYACTGWVGRNPFLNYVLGNDLHEARKYQRERLESGLKGLAKYTDNPQFLSVIKNFDVSWDSVSRYISEFERVSEAWGIFKESVDM